MIEDEFRELVKRVKELHNRTENLEFKVRNENPPTNDIVADIVELRISFDDLIYDIDNNNLWDSSSDYDDDDGWKSSALSC